MATLDELKASIDLHDLAEKLGLARPHGRGNYRSPLHPDKNPSLSIYEGARRWKDHSGDAGGTCIDLVMYVQGVPFEEAVRWLRDAYGMPAPRVDGPREPRTLAEQVAARCLAERERALSYLTEERRIPEATVAAALQAGTVGFNDYTNPKYGAGEPGHGGPAAAFIVRTAAGRIMAVDLRYLDAELNGGQKTKCLGEKQGYVWCSDWRRLKKARTVYLTESPINALSCEAARPFCAAVAIRGTSNLRGFDWSFLAGKRAVIAMDNDPPQARNGRRPGAEAAWALHGQLTAQGIAAHLVDQEEWPPEWNDVNDVLKAGGKEELAKRLLVLEQWAIAGMPRDPVGRRRLDLPGHHRAIYWRYRTRPDFTYYVKKKAENEEEGSDQYDEVAGFRIQAISRVTVAEPKSALSGEASHAPTTLFAAYAQSPWHGEELVRRVFVPDDLNNVDQWGKVGPVMSPARFKRLLTILGHAAHLNERRAVNFVGLAWKDGAPAVIEGADCFFTHPEKQCPYHNLVFPSGPAADAARVIDAYQATFRKNAALQLLTWSLGAHLKCFLGFWPHATMQARKGSGKSTLVGRLEGTVAMNLLSSQNLATEFRILTSVSHTSQPVAWEETSRLPQKSLSQVDDYLQQAYNYTTTWRSSEITHYLICAPVLLLGEDVPFPGLTGKSVRFTLNNRKGAPLPWDLPPFPVRQWLEFLAGHTRPQIQEMNARKEEFCLLHCRAPADDEGGKRMVRNYAALLTAWELLAEFAGIHPERGEFIVDLMEEMNEHVAETTGEREPWVWILEVIFSEIAAGNFRHPCKFDHVRAEDREHAPMCLVARPGDMIHHIRHTAALRQTWDGLSIKSPRVFAAQLRDAGVVAAEVERTIDGTRYGRMTAIDLDRLARYGIHPPSPSPDPEPAWR